MVLQENPWFPDRLDVVRASLQGPDSFASKYPENLCIRKRPPTIAQRRSKCSRLDHSTIFASLRLVASFEFSPTTSVFKPMSMRLDLFSPQTS